MKRREAIKNLSLGIGYVISGPAVLGLLESCSKPGPDWKSVFLSPDQRNVVSHLVDIILPSSEIPGGLDLNLPQFIDKMCSDLLTEKDKAWFNRGSDLFAESLSSMTGREVSKTGRKQVLKVFESYFNVSPREKNSILQAQSKGEETLTEDEKDNYALYKFLFITREFSLLGYYTSEEIGKNVLVFDPIPGGFKPCIPLSDVGKAWTIDP